MTWIFEYGIAPSIGLVTPNITIFAVLIMLGFLFYTITRHRLFSFDDGKTGDSIINIIPEVVIITGVGGLIVKCNKSSSAMLGFSPGELEGTNIGLLFKEKKYLEKFFEELGPGEKVFDGSVEMCCMGKGGRESDAMITASLIRDEFGDIKWVVFVLVDISKRKELENKLKGSLNKMAEINLTIDDDRDKLLRNYEKLKDLDRLKSNFLSMVSHELRTPLTSIKGFISFFLGGATGPLNEKQREHLVIMKNNADRLLKLINELLDLSRIESGVFSVDCRNFDIVALVNVCVREVTSIARDRRVIIHVESEFDSFLLNIDEYRISQAVINILGNSLKFVNEGSEITVGIKHLALEDISFPGYADREKLKKGRYISISVSDRGIGIDAENIPKLFSRFYQVEDINTRKHQGAGLGLAITREIIMAHNGTVWAESEGKDKGSVFYMILPVS